MGPSSHFSLPANEPAATANERLDRYQNRREIVTKVASVVGVWTYVVITVATTDFSKHAPGWLRATAIVLLLLGGAGIGMVWAGFHWKAVQLERQVKASSNEDEATAGAEGKSQERMSELKSEDGSQKNVPLEAWPNEYETWWTLSLYVLILDGAALIALVFWSVT